MKHYVAFKFKENSGAEDDKTLRTIHEAYKRLQTSVDGFTGYEIMKNCVDRSSNFNFMISMDIADETALQTYLSHQYHVDLVSHLMPYIDQLMTFDCE